MCNDAHPIDIGNIQFKQNETSKNIEKICFFRKNTDSEYFINMLTRNHGLMGSEKNKVSQNPT